MSKVKEAESSTSPQFADTSKPASTFSLKRSPTDYMKGSTKHARDVTSKANKMVHGEKPSFFSRFRKSDPKIVTKFNEQPLPQSVDALDPTSLRVPTNVSPNVYLTAAAVSEHQGAIDKAIMQYQKLLEIDPNHRQGLIRLARVLHSNGRMQESIATYQKAVAAYPNDSVILNDMGLCLARNGQHAEAISRIQQAQQMDPTNAMYSNNLAAVMVESNRIPEAIDVLTQKHGPAIAHYNVGYMLNQQGEAVAATEHFTTSLQYNPNLQQARQMLDQLTPMISQRPSGTRSAQPVTHQSKQQTEQFYYPETQPDEAVNRYRSEPAEYYQDSRVQRDSTIPSESYVATDLPLGLEGEPAPIIDAAEFENAEPELMTRVDAELVTAAQQPRFLGQATDNVSRAIGQLTDETDRVMQTGHVDLTEPSIAQPPSQLKILGRDKSEAIEPPLPMSFR